MLRNNQEIGSGQQIKFFLIVQKSDMADIRMSRHRDHRFSHQYQIQIAAGFLQESGKKAQKLGDALVLIQTADIDRIFLPVIPYFSRVTSG